MIEYIKAIFYKVKEWFVSHQKNLLLLVGILFVGILAFESGYLRGKLSQSPEPMIISVPVMAESQAVTETVAGDQLSGVEKITLKTSGKQSIVSCPLMGSRNSNKYHLPTCAAAKRIKPENKVCFASKEDAEKRGYLPGCLK